MENILTITIPTYNRKTELNKTLDALEEQTNQNFKVFISDNCSDFDIFEVLKNRAEDFCSRVEISRNNINIGSTGNICNLFMHVNTEWVWVIGDDDTIYGNAVELIYKYLDKYKNTVSWIEFPVFEDLSIVQHDVEFQSLPELIDFFYINREKINVTSFGELAFVGNKVFNFKKTKKAILTMYEHNYVRMSTTLLILKLADLNERGILAQEHIMNYGQDDGKGLVWSSIKVCQGTRIYGDIDLNLSLDYRHKLFSIVTPPDFIIFKEIWHGRYSPQIYYTLRNLYFEIYKYIATPKQKLKFKIVMWFQKTKRRYELIFRIRSILRNGVSQ